MKQHTFISAATAVAAISFGLLASVNGQEAETKIKVGDAEAKAKVQLPDRDHNTAERDRDRDARYRAARTGDQNIKVGKINKASGLTGMEVKNHLGENLGEIQDLVLDLPSGRISYVVLSVGGFLGVGEKYIAIPPSVFTVAPGGEKVVLHADKSRIQGAPGFVKTSWPDVNNPNFAGLAYWSTDDSQQTIRLEERPRLGADRLDPDRNNRDRFERDPSPNNRGKALPGGHTFKGRITKINPETRTMTVAGESGTMSFTFTDKPVISLKDNRNAQLADLKVGFPIVIGYHDEGVSHVVHSVIRTDSPEVK
jgi:sporulation protein YlmC with PRC-barrel domain